MDELSDGGTTDPHRLLLRLVEEEDRVGYYLYEVHACVCIIDCRWKVKGCLVF